MSLAILLFCLSTHAFLLKYSKKEEKIFQSVLLFSNIYFCGGAYYFWLVINETYFAGLIWGVGALERAILTLSISTTMVAVLVCAITNKPITNVPAFTKSYCDQLPKTLWLFCGVAFISSLVVLNQGVFGDIESRGAFFLIAYQCSDLFVPAILFLVALRGVSKSTIVLTLYFIFYASMVGFRYKIALLAIPLITLLMFSELKKSKKAILVGAAMLTVMTLFSLLTLFRSKFSGIDINRSLDDVWSDLQYGFFAESNIIFGLSSALTQYIDKEQFYFIEPVVDIFREWIPRVIVPDRVTGAYLTPMQLGFITEEGINSGTAYPFIGEFAIMLGWFGIVFGIFAFAAWYVYLRNRLFSLAISKEAWIAGLGLIAAVMAYYHYSRGYLPQIAKSYIFIVFPYYWLCSQQKNIVQRRIRAMLKTPRLGRSRKNLSAYFSKSR